jgi:small conductance mechanosensitive channel
MEQGINNIKSLTGNLALDTIVSGLLTLIVCYIAIRVVKTVVDKALGKAKKLDAPVKNLISKTVTALLWAVTIIIVAGAFGINATSLVALLSVVGLALSMSVQGMMTNFFSGIMLHVNKPFKEGDFIECGDKVGVVKNIGFFNTKINTLDNVATVVPNADLTGTVVKNYSREPLRRVDMTFCTSYDVPTADAKKAILEAIAKDSRILADPAPFVRLGTYKGSCIEYIVRVWCKNADYWDVHFDLNENVRECFAANGVSMSYEHINVHMLDK